MMNFTNKNFAQIASLALLSSPAIANEPTLIGCGPKAELAHLSVQAEASTSLDNQWLPNCPLLEEKKLRKLVDRFGVGTMFAHPVIPGFCLSGIVNGGTLQFIDRDTVVQIDTDSSYSESAQRLFPVPVNQGGVNLFAASSDGTLQAGAAMTAIHLEGVDDAGDSYEFDVLLDDHFLVTSSGEDTEDFLVVGSRGDYKVSGRLTGRGQIISQPQEPLKIEFQIEGFVCLK